MRGRIAAAILPTLMRLLSHSPAALNGYLSLRASLKDGILPTQLREQIAIAVASMNGCHCCTANHTCFGRCVGLLDDEIDAARESRSGDPAAAAALKFARVLIEARGSVDDPELAAIRRAGFGDAAIMEIVGVVAASIFANLVNNLAHSAPYAAAASRPPCPTATVVPHARAIDLCVYSGIPALRKPST